MESSASLGREKEKKTRGKDSRERSVVARVCGPSSKISGGRGERV